MSSSIEGYTLGWNDYANNFSINLKDMLQREELIDVTLVADGHMFGAHRLVLSALSPYFQQMFTQMPVNQQAFVFLKDVPKETLENVITFIYCGNVNVEQEHLEEFFSTAKALDIKGLADGGYANSSDVQLPVFIPFAPNYNNLQYQSTQTTPVPDQVQPNYEEPSHFEQPMNTLHQLQNNFEYDDSNELNVSGNEYGDYFGSNVGDGDSMAMDRGSAMQDDQRNNDSTYSAETVPAKPKRSKTKRAKTDVGTTEYNTIADIRTNANGNQNIIFADQKFGRHHRPNRHGQQRWQCTKQKLQNHCRAAVSTMEVNGIMMMKVVVAEHSHE